jgi:hypothetical protein
VVVVAETTTGADAGGYVEAAARCFDTEAGADSTATGKVALSWSAFGDLE